MSAAPTLTLADTYSGVWAIVDRDYHDDVDRDYHDDITMVYPSELEALRALNGRGYGKVKFIPWGKSLTDLANEEAKA